MLRRLLVCVKNPNIFSKRSDYNNFGDKMKFKLFLYIWYSGKLLLLNTCGALARNAVRDLIIINLISGDISGRNMYPQFISQTF